MFFFEKKNQKTFDNWACAVSASCDSIEKFFASFFQKRSASLHPDRALRCVPITGLRPRAR
jgi:hypothetical protein